MRLGIGGAFAIVVGTLLGVAMLTMAGWEAPPIDAEQIGYRGVAMEKLTNPRTERRLMAANQAPEPVWPLEPAPADAPRAGDVYENLQVLADQPAEQHDRLMAAITEWIAPEAGCAYCHNEENYAEDSVYTKIVARDMLRMTIHINSNCRGITRRMHAHVHFQNGSQLLIQNVFIKRKMGDNSGEKRITFLDKMKL